MNDFNIDYPNSFGFINTPFEMASKALENVFLQAEKHLVARTGKTSEEIRSMTPEEHVVLLKSVGILGFTLETDWIGNTMKLTLKFIKDNNNGTDN